MRSLALALVVVLAAALGGCARYQPVPRGDFDVVHDATGAVVVPRGAPAGASRVLVRRPDLPARGLPIVVAVGNVAVFETARRVRAAELAGTAAQAWFTPGQRLFVRGVAPGRCSLRLTLASGKRRTWRVDVY